MNDMIPVRVEISDAITLYVMQTNTFKTARLSIHAMSPAKKETFPMEMLLFGILRRGCEKYPSLAHINRRLDELYGTTLTIRNFFRGDNHVLSLTAEMLSDSYTLPHDPMNVLDGTMELLADVLLHPVRDEKGNLRKDIVKAEKRALIDSVRAEINDTKSYATTRLRMITCRWKSEPFGWALTGHTDMVEKISYKDMTSFFDNRLSEARWVVYYVGDASPEQVAVSFKQAFRNFAPQPLRLHVDFPHPPPSVPFRLEETYPVRQGMLCMSWSLGISDTTPPKVEGEDDYAAALVLCEMFGIMQSSLLFRRVREELGLCYFCDAAFEIKQGILSVISGIHPKNREAAEAAILEVFKDIREGRFTSMDLGYAKTSLYNGYSQVYDSAAAMESYFFWQDRYPQKEPMVMQDRVIRVSAEDIIRVANKFILDAVYFLNAEKAEEVDEYDG